MQPLFFILQQSNIRRCNNLLYPNGAYKLSAIWSNLLINFPADIPFGCRSVMVVAIFRY